MTTTFIPNTARLGRMTQGMVLCAALWAGASAQAVTTGVTISGSVTQPSTTVGGAAVPLVHVPVALLNQANLGPVLTTNAGYKVVFTDTSGHYVLSGVQPGRYFLGPYTPGTIYRVNKQSNLLSPVVVVETSTAGALTANFEKAAVDVSNPVLTIDTPAAPTSAKPSIPSLPLIKGTLTDPVSGTPRTAGGPLGVGAAIYRTAGGTINVYNWHTGAFEVPKAPPTPIGLPKITDPRLNPDYYAVKLVTGVRFTPPGAAFPTEIRGAFSIALPKPLLAGTYQLSMAGIDGSLRRSAIVSRAFTIGSTPPPTTKDTTPPTASVLTVGTTNVSAGTPTSPISVPSLSSVAGNAADAGSGVASVKLYVIRNLHKDSFISYKADFWNGTSFVLDQTLTLGTVIASLPSVSTTLSPTAGGASVTWTRSSGLPTDSGNYGLLAIATDKAGNVTKPTSLQSFDDLAALQAAVRTVSVSSTQPT